MNYPKFILTYADDVFKFIRENEDGTLHYESFGGNSKINIDYEDIGVKYRVLE